MRIGLLADIHESVDYLELALEQLAKESVDRIISLGDFCECGTQLERTCQLLLDANVEGVWGNHDFGLCEDARQGTLTDYSQSVVQFSAAQVANLRFESLFFSHVEPWLDHNRLEDLWYFEGVPDTPEKRRRLFAAYDFKIAFAGHMHTWLAISETGNRAWNGKVPLNLSGERHFVIIDACCRGCFAVYDTSTQILTPHTLKTESRLSSE